MEWSKPFVCSGPTPKMGFPEVGTIANLAWKLGFAARLEEGLVMRIYGGDVYLMVCYRDTNAGHRFQEANGNGYLFRAHEYDEFLEYLAVQTPIKADPKPEMRVSSYARLGGA